MLRASMEEGLLRLKTGSPARSSCMARPTSPPTLPPPFLTFSLAKDRMTEGKRVSTPQLFGIVDPAGLVLLNESRSLCHSVID